MRKNKKILLLISLVVFITFISQQLYYYAKYEGNLIFLIWNASSADSTHIEIYVDGNKEIDNKSIYPRSA